jgi:hypothetical protein
MNTLTSDQVKSVILRHRARASFRRSGPGIKVLLREALHAMNQEQREVALTAGFDKGHLYRGKASGKLGVRRG